MIAGIGAAAITALAYSKKIIIFYLIALIVPTIVKFLLVGDTISIVMALILLLYLIVTLRIAIRTYNNYINTLKLKNEYTKKSRELNIQKQRLEHFFNNVPIGIFFYDENLKLVNCNRFFADILGIDKEKLIGFDMNKLYNKEVLAVIKGVFEKKSENCSGDILLTSDKFVEVYTSFVEHEDGKIEGVGAVIDITELKRSQEKIEKLAYYDELTELAKRSLFFKNVDFAIKRVQNEKVYSSLIYLDIDDFKI